jgi:hypothetical protein
MIQFMSITMQVLTYAVTICTIIRRMRTGIEWLEKLRFLDVPSTRREHPEGSVRVEVQDPRGKAIGCVRIVWNPILKQRVEVQVP